MSYKKLLRPVLVFLIAVFAAAFLLTLFTSFAAGGDPAVPQVTISAVPDVHRVAPGNDVYFNPSNGGVITAVVHISGTTPLTFTTAPAFNRPGEVFTYTSSPASPELSYTVANNSGSQLGITYTVVNSYGLSTETINYIRDITTPVTVMTTTYGVITSNISSPLLLAGTVSDAGSGIGKVRINPAGAGYVDAVLGDTGDHITNTTWSYQWPIPSANGTSYQFQYRGVDNLGLTEDTQAQAIIVDNVAPPIPGTPTITVQGTTLHIVWGNSTGAVGYRLTLYEGNDVITVDRATTTYDYVGTIGESYSAKVEAYDNVHNYSASTPTSNQVFLGRIFMPLLSWPIAGYSDVTGSFNISSARLAGITTFIQDVTVNFSTLTFFPVPPDEMRIWRSDQNEPTTWANYNEEGTLTLSNAIGLQTVYARFHWAGVTNPSNRVEASIFYIPNGDFAGGVDILQNSGWVLTSNTLPYSVAGGKLILGSPAYGCTNVPIGDAQANFALNIPANSNYKLYVDADVYTYDQLPDPNQAIYDAFEIHVGSNVNRFGNPVAPIDCSILRTINVSASISLPTGLTNISLRNVTRFDNLFNTYTEIDKVWVDIQ